MQPGGGWTRFSLFGRTVDGPCLARSIIPDERGLWTSYLVLLALFYMGCTRAGRVIPGCRFWRPAIGRCLKIPAGSSGGGWWMAAAVGGMPSHGSEPPVVLQRAGGALFIKLHIRNLRFFSECYNIPQKLRFRIRTNPDKPVIPLSGCWPSIYLGIFGS